MNLRAFVRLCWWYVVCHRHLNGKRCSKYYITSTGLGQPAGEGRIDTKKSGTFFVDVSFLTATSDVYEQNKRSIG